MSVTRCTNCNGIVVVVSADPPPEICGECEVEFEERDLEEKRDADAAFEKENRIS